MIISPLYHDLVPPDMRYKQCPHSRLSRFGLVSRLSLQSIARESLLNAIPVIRNAMTLLVTYIYGTRFIASLITLLAPPTPDDERRTLWQVKCLQSVSMLLRLPILNYFTGFYILD